jgi:hypothetical protein
VHDGSLVIEPGTVPVLVAAADGAAWEARLVTEFASGRHGVRIVRRCLDVVELLAVAATGQARACLISADLRRLDADAVDQLTAVGVATVAVVPRGDEQALDRLAAYGVTSTVPHDADAAVVASVVLDAGLRGSRCVGVRTPQWCAGAGAGRADARRARVGDRSVGTDRGAGTDYGRGRARG